MPRPPKHLTYHSQCIDSPAGVVGAESGAVHMVHSKVGESAKAPEPDPSLRKQIAIPPYNLANTSSYVRIPNIGRQARAKVMRGWFIEKWPWLNVYIAAINSPSIHRRQSLIIDMDSTMLVIFLSLWLYRPHTTGRLVVLVKVKP